MSVSAIAAEFVFCIGWVAIGAAAVFSRYKKALELDDPVRGPGKRETVREYHRGLFFGRSRLNQEPPQTPMPQTPMEAGATSQTAPGLSIPSAAPVALSAVIDALPSLVHLAKALENVAEPAQPEDPASKAAPPAQPTSTSSGS